MSLADLLFSTPAMLYDSETGLKELILGPIISEGESYSASVASHALENGSEVSDHVHAQPASFSVTTFLVDKNDLMSSAASLVLGSDKSVDEKITQLKEWHESGELLVYSGPVFSGFFEKGYDMYVEDVVISSMSIGRGVDKGAGLEVTLSLRKITIADTQMMSVNLPQPVKKAGAKGKTSTGKTSATAKSRSILSKMFG